MDVSKIGKVAAVAKITEQKTAKALTLGQQSYQHKLDQLGQLQSFKQEYEVKLSSMGINGIDARQLQDYRLFLSKLNLAINQQVEDLQVSEKKLDTLRDGWLSESRRKTALDHLVDAGHKKQIQAMEKAEQKQSDESSLTRTLSRDT